MDKKNLQAYSTRVASANRSELVVITYEIILDEIRYAVQSFEAQDMEKFKNAIYKSRQFLNELMGCLDYKYSISSKLMALYIYTDKQLVKASAEKTKEPLYHADLVIKQLLTGFKEVAKQDNSDPLMSNTQKIYAGLTYGKGVLNETYVSVNESNRGFKA